jgi:hypothetical protein
MEYGIQFAETGHLVLATLHANSSNQALIASSTSSPMSGANSCSWIAQHPRARRSAWCRANRLRPHRRDGIMPIRR